MKFLTRVFCGTTGPLFVATLLVPFYLSWAESNIGILLGAMLGQLTDPFVLMVVLITLFLAKRWWHVLIGAILVAAYQALRPHAIQAPGWAIFSTVAGAYTVMFFVGILSPLRRLFSRKSAGAVAEAI